jgi:hypothetical protein
MLESSIVSSPEEDERIATHPLMQKEQRVEEDDIRFLSVLPDSFGSDAVSTVKARASKQDPLLPPRTRTRVQSAAQAGWLRLLHFVTDAILGKRNQNLQ